VRDSPKSWMSKIVLGVLICLPVTTALLGSFRVLGGDPPICEEADQRPCEDLLQADIRVVVHQELSTLRAVCPHPESDACALRSASWGEAYCVIHQWTAVPEAIYEHEMNHCRGWDHDDDSAESYHRPWHVNRGLWLARGAGLYRAQK
jgi:hypothetical protein